MNTFSERHPDELNNNTAVKNMGSGSMQAIDDKAVAAYIKALEAGATKDDAEKEFFKYFCDAGKRV